MKKVILSISLLISLSCFAQVPTNGLAGEYTFTGNANDVSGNNYHGTVYGATLTTDRFGNPSCAYHFNGIDNYIDLSSYVAAFNTSQPKSLSFWVRTNDDNPGGDGNTCSCIFSFSDDVSGSNENILTIGMGNNTTGSLTNELTSVYFRNSSSDYYIAGYTTANRSLLIDNMWHHIVYDFNGSSTKIYLDGNMVLVSCNYGTNNGHYGNIPNASKAFFGTRWANGAKGAYLDGDLDDCRVYNRSLTSAEVIQLYNEQNPTLSIDQQLNTVNFTVYPNPAHDEVTILWDKDLSNEMEIKVVDLNGKTVLSESVSGNTSVFSMNIENLEKGIYYIQSISSGLQGTKKLIVQ